MDAAHTVNSLLLSRQRRRMSAAQDVSTWPHSAASLACCQGAHQLRCLLRRGCRVLRHPSSEQLLSHTHTHTCCPWCGSPHGATPLLLRHAGGRWLSGGTSWLC